jgi:arylsulfatase A-like enzyme
MTARAMRLARLGAPLLAAALAACNGKPAPDTGPLRWPDAPVVILSIDTLRADRLGCYGYGRGTTPNLDDFADQSVLFQDCYSASCKTAESHMSLFTSLPPTAHGISNFSPRLGLPVSTLAENRVTFPQVLRRAGRFNSAVCCGGNLQGPMGFQRGFEDRFVSELVDVSVIVDRALADVDVALAQPKPWMQFLHTYQVHAPYVPPPEFRERFAPQLDGVVAEREDELTGKSFNEVFKALNLGWWKGVESFGEHEAQELSQLYDGEIAYTDQQFGRLVAGLKQRGVFDKAIVIVLSDHGEEFGEHGHFEHDQLYREHLHVPLLVHLPGGRLGGSKIGGQCSLLDVMPTLLDLLGLPGPDTMTGHSLVAAISAGHVPDEPVLAERLMFADSYAATLRTPGEALLFRASPGAPGADGRPGPGPETGHPADEGRIELYDLRADPDQHHDLGSGAPDWKAATSGFFQRLSSVFELRKKLDEVATSGTMTITPQQAKENAALGYTGAAPGSSIAHWPKHAGR